LRDRKAHGAERFCSGRHPGYIQEERLSGSSQVLRGIKKKGYKLSLQPVSVTSYSDNEMTELLKKVNEIKPYSVSVVDTYGLMHKKNSCIILI